MKWGDFDWNKNLVRIEQQRSGMAGELLKPKTKHGTREINLTAQLVSVLKTHHRLRTPGDFVFPNDERNFRSRVWHPALRRAGLRAVRIHDARHTYCSHLLASGVDVIRVARLMGHCKPSITSDVYGHCIPDAGGSGAVEKLEEYRRNQKNLRGCDLVIPAQSDAQAATEVIDLMVARGGIEPPTRGFSIRCSTN